MVELVARLSAVLNVHLSNLSKEVIAMRFCFNIDLRRYKVLYPSNYYSKPWLTSFSNNGWKGCREMEQSLVITNLVQHSLNVLYLCIICIERNKAIRLTFKKVPDSLGGC
jgi:hypothetical protein